MLLLDAIKDYAVKYPERIAYNTQDKELTYGDLWQLSDKFSTYVVNQSLKPDTPIIVYGHMEPEMLISFLGCVKAGHPYIPIDISIPYERINKILDSSQAGMIINVSKQSLPLQNKAVYMLNHDQFYTAIENEYEPGKDTWVKNEDTFYIIYTSGSTGNPKGVQISANNLQSFVDWIIKDFPITEHQRFLNQAPFSFDLSVMDLYPSLAAGGTLYSITKEFIARPKLLFTALKESNLHVWTSTPSFVQICLMDPSFSQDLLPELSVFLFCGEILPHKTAKMLRDRFPEARIFNMYGPTEATVAITKVEITDDILEKYQTLPVGVPKSDTLILLMTEYGREVAEGDKGEIVIVGPSVSKGYLGEEKLTENAFFSYNGQQAYRTGDAGFLDENQLFYKGRLDFQIKVHGYRMEIEEIEHVISKSQFVKTGVIVPMYKRNEDVVDYLLAVIVPANHTFEKEFELTSAIKKELSKTLPGYMVPRKMFYRNELPITPNGKIDRKRLKAEVSV